MRAIIKHPILTLMTLLVVNILLAFFLISILADGILRYKIGFIVNTPIVVLILLVLILTFSKYYSRENQDLRKTSISIILIILGLLNILFYLFNILCWIDLFDGKTNALLP
jgi:hypothetical protein